MLGMALCETDWTLSGSLCFFLCLPRVLSRF